MREEELGNQPLCLEIALADSPADCNQLARTISRNEEGDIQDSEEIAWE